MSKSQKLSYSDLYPYQHRMIDHIREHDYCALWVDMGLGKTVSTLTAIKQMKEDFDAGNVLVVAPKRVARKTWTDEIQNWSHLTGLTTSIIVGSGAQQRLAAARKKADIHLINRENLSWLSEHFMEFRAGRWHRTRKWPWDTVVLDESLSFKSEDSLRFQTMARLRQWVTRLIELTGTPAPKGLQDLWGQMWLLDRGQRLGRTLGAFRQRWMEPPGYSQHKWTMKKCAEAQIHNAVGDIALTMRAEDYLDLPPVIPRFIRVRMTVREHTEYTKFKRLAVMELAGKRITAVNAGVLWGKLMQLANGAVYTDHPQWAAFHDAKLDALMEIEEDNPEPMMIVYNYRSDLARIREAFDRRGVDYRVLQSEQDEDDWNAGKFSRLIIHPESAGEGTNLHENGCELQIWFGLTPKTYNYLQTVARIAGGHRRIGKNVRILHIVADDTIDEDARFLMEDNIDTNERLMEATKKIVRECT